MIKIICNRCNKPIESIDKVGFIQFCYHNPFESVTDDNISDRNHYCDDCMTEIEQFVRNNNYIEMGNAVAYGIQEGLRDPIDSVVEQVKGIAGNITENINHKENDTPPLREKDFKSEPNEQSKRRRIDYERIMSLKESGMRNRDIAAEMGMYPQEVSTAIYTYKKRQGKTVKTERKESASKEVESKEPQDREKKIDVGKIRALWNAKWSISKIADEMDMAEFEIIDVLGVR